MVSLLLACASNIFLCILWLYMQCEMHRYHFARTFFFHLFLASLNHYKKHFFWIIAEVLIVAAGSIIPHWFARSPEIKEGFQKQIKDIESNLFLTTLRREHKFEGYCFAWK